MLGRQFIVPLALTVLCVLAVVGTASIATGTTVPTLAFEQSGHWLLDRLLGSAVHVDGGTRQVDAQVALPADAVRDGLATVQGATNGYVVGRDRTWVFDKSTLTVVSSAPTVVSEVPVPIEVVGGPYLVYRKAGTVVRLGQPATVAHAGGPLSAPVRTADGTVWVFRSDSGAVCALRRDALELDCSARARVGAPGGLTVTAATATFVDAGVDTAQLVRGPALESASRLGSDLPDDVLLADQATTTRLPVVTPVSNLLRLLDCTGIPSHRPGSAPVDIPLGPGTFGAPVVSGDIIAVLELTTSRLFTFTATGTSISVVQLPPGTDANAISRGEDGRIYVDEPGGGGTRVVQPDGTVAAVPFGDGIGSSPAVAPPEAQRSPVTPPPPGRIQVPVPKPGPPVAAPAPKPDAPIVPNPPVPNPPDPKPPVVPGPDPGPPSGTTTPPVVEKKPPAAPMGVTAQLTGADQATVTWQPVDGDGLAVTYVVTPSSGGGTVSAGQTQAVVKGLAPATTFTFTVSARTSAGTSPNSAPSNAVATASAAPAAPTGLAGTRANESGSLFVFVTWTAPTAGPPPSSYEVTVTGKKFSGTKVVTAARFDDANNFCSPEVTYSIRSIGTGSVKSAPASVVVNSPVDCTVKTQITSTVANSDGTVTVVVDCQSAGRSPDELGPIILRFYKNVVDSGSQTCKKSAAVHDLHTYTIGGLQRDFEYPVQAQTTSTTGNKYSDTVFVRTSP